MRKVLTTIAILLAPLPLQAADKALILNDQEQIALRAILDAAIRASGLSQLSRNAFVLSDRLDQAGTVTAQSPVAPTQEAPK